VEVTVEAMYDDKMEAVENCPHPKQKLWIKLSTPAQVYDLIRVKHVNEA
jgi:putative protease